MKKNSHTSTSSQVSEDSRLPENGRDSGRLSSAKKKSSARKFSKSIGQKSPLSQKSETLMEKNGEVQLSLPGVSPASLFPLPGQEQVRKTTVISGRKCSASLKKRGLAGYLLRMLLESSNWHSERCYLTWKASDMISQETTKGLPSFRLYQLVASMPPIGVIESGLLLMTPEARNQEGYQIVMGKKYPRLGKQIAMLRTPSGQEPGIKAERLITKKGEPAKIGERAYDKKTGRLAQVGLAQQIVMLPTPNAWDGRRGPGKELNMKSKSQKDRTLETVIQKGLLPTPTDSMVTMQDLIQAKFHSTKRPKYSEAMLPTPRSGNPGSRKPGTGGKVLNEEIGKKTGMKLQPTFVEWLMGFPIGFTDLKHSETPSCHK